MTQVHVVTKIDHADPAHFTGPLFVFSTDGLAMENAKALAEEYALKSRDDLAARYRQGGFSALPEGGNAYAVYNDSNRKLVTFSVSTHTVYAK